LNYTALFLAHSVNNTSNVAVAFLEETDMINQFEENGVEALVFEVI